MNFGFWNISNNNYIDDVLYDFAWDNQLDVLMLGESTYSPQSLLGILNKNKSAFYFAPSIVCDKIQFYTKFNPKNFKLITETNRISARKLFSPKFGLVTLIVAHYNSKVNWSNEDQSAHIPTFKEIIDLAEKKTKHKRTIVCGDLNMNPFDTGMVQTTGLHSVMNKKIAERISRTVDGRVYDFFYNPMWSFLGDSGKSRAAGTLYYSPAKPISYHWNLFDQVLIRPELINSFDESKLDIVSLIGTTDLLINDNLINKKYSDHLPIKFSINI